MSADTDTEISAETDTETDNFRSLVKIPISMFFYTKGKGQLVVLRLLESS